MSGRRVHGLGKGAALVGMSVGLGLGLSTAVAVADTPDTGGRATAATPDSSAASQAPAKNRRSGSRAKSAPAAAGRDARHTPAGAAVAPPKVVTPEIQQKVQVPAGPAPTAAPIVVTGTGQPATAPAPAARTFVRVAKAVVAPAAYAAPVAASATASLSGLLTGTGSNPATDLVATLPGLATLAGARQSTSSEAVVPASLVAAAPPDPKLPGLPTMGVSGVQVGHSRLEMPGAFIGKTVAADWYFPTQVDGSVDAQGVIWLQHGFGATKDFYVTLATQLAQQTNSIVVAPTLSTIPFTFSGGCLICGTSAEAAAKMFLAFGRPTLLDSAVAAGYTGDPLEISGASFVMSGHSAGGGFATTSAADYIAGGGNPLPSLDYLRGVVMFDGVSNGVFDGSFTKQIQTLDTKSIPVYQIAAPAQSWNLYGATTNQLLADRPGQFDGVVLVGGSHIDSMLGPNPIINTVLQLVAGKSPAGNTAATYTFSTGWINDLYTTDASPQDPQYGFYPAAGQQVILGNAAAAGLPSPILNQVSGIDAFLKTAVDGVFKLLGIPTPPPVNTGSNGVSTLVTPPDTNGVTGVKTGHSVLTIPSGNGYDANADWYFPTQADGSVQANGIIWLQHGFLGFKDWYRNMATAIAQQTNSIVVAPQIFWFNDAFSGVAAAQMFVGDRAALNISANQAGYSGLLPQNFLLTGHSAGGNFATVAGAGTVDNGAAADLLGVVMFDGVSFPDVFPAAIAKLDSLGIPDYQIAAKPQQWNAYGVTTEELAALHPGQFVGTMIDNGSHTDSVDGNWLADLASALVVKKSPPGGKAAVRTFATGWINDIYAGLGPTNPGYGIYGNPNDGTYVANQSIVMGEAGATTLPAPPPVNVNQYAGTWFEQGSVKLPFAWGLVNTKAVYTPQPDGSIKVQNSGNYFGPNGPQTNITGSAVSVNSPTNTRLNVAFFFGKPKDKEPGNYWILDYAPDYSWAIVSDPSGFSGYILTRDQTVPTAEYQSLVDRARQLGVWGPITPTKQYP